MRIDKLTTKFQEALSEAQSLALTKDNQYIEPAHLLLAMLRDTDGGAKSLLTRAGVNVPNLEKGLEKLIGNLPEVQGSSGEVQVGRDLSNWLNLCEKEANKRGDQFIAGELFLLVVADDKGDLGKLARENADISVVRSVCPMRARHMRHFGLARSQAHGVLDDGLQGLVNRILPLICSGLYNPFANWGQIVVGKPIREIQAVKILPGKHLVDLPDAFPIDAVIRVGPHQVIVTIRRCHLKRHLPRGTEIVHMIPGNSKGCIVVFRSRGSHCLGNPQRPVRDLIANCPNHVDVGGELLKARQEPLDVVFDVPRDHTQCQGGFFIRCIQVHIRTLPLVNLMAPRGQLFTPAYSTKKGHPEGWPLPIKKTESLSCARSQHHR